MDIKPGYSLKEKLFKGIHFGSFSFYTQPNFEARQ